MKLAAVLFTIFIIIVIVLADRGQLGPIHFLYDFPNGDKLGHFFLYGLLNFFVTRAFLSAPPSRPRGCLHLWRRHRWITLFVGLTLAVLIALEEISQKYFSTRTEDIVDLLASYAGLIVGGWLALKTNKK